MTLSRFTDRFAALNSQNEKALVTFITAGDPYPERTTEVVNTLIDAGADIIELGIPFSDPVADGPTIQASSFRALSTGMTPPKVLDIVRQVRQSGRTETPIVLMGSWNPILQYGMRKFAEDAVAAGADGSIITDLTPEEAGEWKREADTAGFGTIFLLAPTSTKARMALVGKMASGFIYCVSRLGVTGARSDVSQELPELTAQIRSFSGDTPVCVGFGIGKPEQVARVAPHADGIVVGSALVDRLHQNRENPESLDDIKEFVASLKAATKGTNPS